MYKNATLIKKKGHMVIWFEDTIWVKKKMIIRLNSKNCKRLIYAQIILVLIMFFLISVCHFPTIISYITDIINLILLYCILKMKSVKLNKLGGKHIKNSIVLFVISLLVGVVLNLVSPLLVVWGARNLLRGFVFFIACVKFLDKEDVDKIMKIFLIAQIMNLLVSLYQFFVLGIRQDYLGGIFGTEQGCNGITNIFFVILLIYYCVNYINKNVSLYILAFVAISTVAIAALAELKIYYLEFALIIVLTILFTKPSFKTFFAMGIAIIGLIIFINVIKTVFPLQYDTMITFEALKQYAEAQGGGYNISRINAFSEINDLFFRDNFLLKLFGFGLGNCEMSSFDFLVSDFYELYGAYNYRWFSHMMIYLQNGMVGIILFIIAFLQIFIHATRARIKCSKSFNSYAIFTQIFSILVILNIWYNQIMLSDVQYLIYFGLSICLITIKTSIYKESRV